MTEGYYIPLNNLEGYLMDTDVAMLVRHNLGLHTVISECIRIVLDKGIRDPHYPMAKSQFVSAVDTRDLQSRYPERLTDQCIMAVNHYAEITYTTYKRLYPYIHEIVNAYIDRHATQYFVTTKTHRLEFDGSIYIKLDVDFIPFNDTQGRHYGRTSTNTPHATHRKAL